MVWRDLFLFPATKVKLMSSQSVITPIQKWLLAQGKCVSCGKDLTEEERVPSNGHFLITCECRRVFVWEPAQELYRRAFLEDVR